MLATLIPLFDKDMRVCAYSLFSQKENYLLNPALQGSSRNDGAASVSGLEIIKNIGIDTLSPGTDVFIPVGPIAVFSDIEAESDTHDGRLVLLFDNAIQSNEPYQKRLKQLKDEGYKLAIKDIAVSDYEKYKNILALMDYVILDCRKVDILQAEGYFRRTFPNIKICAGNVESQEMFDRIKGVGSIELYEGKFYRIPVTKGKTEIAPLKVNYLELMNIVNDADYELSDAADVIGRDTALVVELLKVVNRFSVNSKITSIRHAAAILGQKELKRWINTVITKELCADRPSEIARLSLLRAKFIECMAPSFELAMKTSELFLLGLFSVLDIILSVPMEEALQKVMVSKDITEALVNRKGLFADILDFILKYEAADWQEVCRLMIVKNIDVDTVYAAYTESVCWYKQMFFDTEAEAE